MHQEHNIPWNILASNVKFIRENRRVTPWRTSYFARNLPTQGKTLNHFARSLESAISTFAKTERAKYPESLVPDPSGKIFSDELRDRYPEFLNEKNQLIDHWIIRASRVDVDNVYYSYTWQDEDLCEVVNTLFHENALPSLLMLAQHPKIPLHTLHSPCLMQQHGTQGVAVFALWSYIFFNLAAAAGTLQTREYLEMDYQKWGRSILPAFQSHILPHREFLGNPLFGPPDRTTLPVPHRDLPALREYLKTMFRLLYSYEVVMRECGQDPKWEEEVVYSICDIVSGIKRDVRTEDASYTVRFAC